jgi:hypothetical protein
VYQRVDGKMVKVWHTFVYLEELAARETARRQAVKTTSTSPPVGAQR